MTSRSIEIIGGGIAGLSLGAALARSGVRTTILESGAYPRHRVCGEFIAGLGESEIAILGLKPVLQRAVCQRSVAWFGRERRMLRQTLATPAWGISRLTLDQKMAEAFVHAGGELRTGTRVTDTRCPVGRVLTVGRIARTSPWIGLKMHVRGISLAADLEVHLGRSSYVGLCRVEDGWINVCGLFSRRHVKGEKAPSLFGGALENAGLFDLKRRLADAEVRAGSQVATAGLHYETDELHHGGLSIGDAMATIPPFTGRGMAMAFLSAAKALEPLQAWARGESSWVRTVDDAQMAIRSKLHRSRRLARFLHPWLVSPFRQRLFFAGCRANLLPMRSLTRILHG